MQSHLVLHKLSQAEIDKLDTVELDGRTYYLVPLKVDITTPKNSWFGMRIEHSYIETPALVLAPTGTTSLSA